MCVYDSERRKERRSFHSERESESAAVSTVAAVEEAFHDESRDITGKNYS